MKILFYLMIFVLGAFLGRVAITIINQVPLKKNKEIKRYVCSKCKHEIKTIDSIPILSYIISKGKCRYCGNKIRSTDFIIEVLMGIVSIGIYLTISITENIQSILEIEEYIYQMIFITTLVIIAGIDKKNKKIYKPVIFFGCLIELINISYMYITKNITIIHIYKYVIYLACILLISTITSKNKYFKYSYLLEIMMVCIYINMFITSEVFLITAILTMISLTISVIIKKQQVKVDKSDILAEKNVNLDISIGFYLCISNVIAMLIQGIPIM